MREQPTPSSAFRCPACRVGRLTRRTDEFACPECAASYPLIDDIPWLFEHPQRTRAEWRQRLHLLLVELRREAAESRAALERPGVTVAARNRLKLAAAAYDDQARRLATLLAPLGADDLRMGAELHGAFGTTAPRGAGIAAYYVNLHRDWVWGREETDAMYRLVAELLGDVQAGHALVLGAGAGRLVHDLATQLDAESVVALDVNPLLAIVGRRVMRGERLQLYEFPLAPRDAESQAVLRTLAAEQSAPRAVQWVLADATSAPFPDGAFDTVITPWLIDIIDEDFAAFAPRINALLADGGRWINTGSLVFSNTDRAARYTLAEVTSLVEAAGFETPKISEQQVPYMCSPASRHGRVETVVTFRADKQRNVSAPERRKSLPSWLERTDEPVPALPAFRSDALTMRIYGYVATLIDGQRSIRAIAAELVRERLMEADAAEAAVHGFVTKLYEDTRRGPRF